VLAECEAQFNTLLYHVRATVCFSNYRIIGLDILLYSIVYFVVIVKVCDKFVISFVINCVLNVSVVVILIVYCRHKK